MGSTLIRRVVCGISGGVDSAVTALLLKKTGFDVVGAHMTNWDVTNEAGECKGEHDREDAEFVCKHLDIPLHHVNFVKEYWNDVFSPFLSGYERGETPNVDVLCNKAIKFGPFYKYAMATLGADAIATGHYARNSAGPFLEHIYGCERVQLLRGVDRVKDQTVFLSQIPQSVLKHTMFPVGHLLKSKVKEIAAETGLDRIVQKRESTGICFVGERDFHKFIEEYIEPVPGNFVDIETGNVVGSHQGGHYFTIGQRALIPGLSGEAYFIASISKKSPDILVAKGTKHPALHHQSLVTEPAHWICYEPEQLADRQPWHCQFRFQHARPLINCVVSCCEGGQLHVELEGPLRAITAGQYAVFYEGEVCFGSARISKPGPSLYELGHSELIKEAYR